jgi:hypothetical protein
LSSFVGKEKLEKSLKRRRRKQGPSSQWSKRRQDKSFGADAKWVVSNFALPSDGNWKRSRKDEGTAVANVVVNVVASVARWQGLRQPPSGLAAWLNLYSLRIPKTKLTSLVITVIDIFIYTIICI